jgi:Tol biopolymer transport system component
MAVQSNVSYVPAGNGNSQALLFVKDGTLVQQAFDGSKLTGEPTEITANLDYFAPSVYGAFAASVDGSVLIVRPANGGLSQLRWFDRSGKPQGSVGPPGNYTQPRISADGSRVLFSRPDEQTGNRDIWYMEISRGAAARLTTDPANDWFGVWSPDSRNIAFGSDRGGGSNLSLYLKISLEPGKGESTLFSIPGVVASPFDWSHDGKWILFFQKAGGQQLWILPTADKERSFTFLESPFLIQKARFSPDSKWIAYTSNESGRFEVYVRSFAGVPQTNSDRIQVSTGGGDFPVWQNDGKELFFVGADLKMYSVRTADLGKPGTVPQVTLLFTPCADSALAEFPMAGAVNDHPYDVAPDGQRFLFNCRAAPPDRYDVLLNWRPLSSNRQ